MAIRVAKGEFAANIPGAGDHTAANGARRCSEVQRLDRVLRFPQPGFVDVGDEEVLPHGQPQGAGTEPFGDVRQPTQLGGAQSSGSQRDAYIKKTRLDLRMDADMAVSIDSSARLASVERQ